MSVSRVAQFFYQIKMYSDFCLPISITVTLTIAGHLVCFYFTPNIRLSPIPSRLPHPLTHAHRGITASSIQLGMQAEAGFHDHAPADCPSSMHPGRAGNRIFFLRPVFAYLSSDGPSDFNAILRWLLVVDAELLTR